MSEFYEGEYIIYQNGEKYELGMITSFREDGAFVCYHDGETAAKTPYSYMHKLVNAYTVKATSLGGDRFKDNEKERPKGKWMVSEGEKVGALGIQYSTYTCPSCGWSNSLIIPRNFCPNCGAKMNGGE